MPFSELFKMTKGKTDVTQLKNSASSPDLSCGDPFGPDNDFVELVWENGQIMMQGQSSRTKKVPSANNIQPLLPKFQDKGSRNSKVCKFGTEESAMDDFALPLPSCDMGLDQEDDVVPWLSYPIEEPLQNDYCSDFLHELSGVTINHVSGNSNVGSLSLQQGSMSKSSSSAVQLNKARVSEVSPSVQLQKTVHRSGVSDISNHKTGNVQSLGYREPVANPAPVTDSRWEKPQKHDGGQPSCTPGFLNFSHFSRPAVLARAALRRSDTTAGAILNSTEGSAKEETGCTLSNSNHPESSLVNLSNVSIPKVNQHVLPPANAVSERMPLKQAEGPILANQSEGVQQKDSAENDKFPNRAHGGKAVIATTDCEKTLELVVASSSVCSANSIERASNDPTHDLKRKCRDAGDSEGPSEEVEEESVHVRKGAHARIGAKRSRAAEVHNLSERRRRDRINEKMRALQELIPNCNKADKASMLDEAIEYLKALQLQVQIMSMASGMCMPPMMLQHMAGPHMPHFPPMGVGMGMGMGFGMNMLDMNGSMMQVPPAQSLHYPVPISPMSTAGFHGMAGPSFQAFGHPGQGLPMSMPRPSILPFPGGSSLKSPMVANGVGMIGSTEISLQAPPTNSKDLMQNVSSQVMPNNGVVPCTMNQVTNGDIQHSAVLHDHTKTANTDESPRSTGPDDAK